MGVVGDHERLLGVAGTLGKAPDGDGCLIDAGYLRLEPSLLFADRDTGRTEAVCLPVREKAPAEEKKEAPKKATRKPAAKKAAPTIIIQSPMGGEITPEDILAKVGAADKVYVRVDQNKAYIVRGEETDSVDLW